MSNNDYEKMFPIAVLHRWPITPNQIQHPPTHTSAFNATSLNKPPTRSKKAFQQRTMRSSVPSSSNPGSPSAIFHSTLDAPSQSEIPTHPRPIRLFPGTSPSHARVHSASKTYYTPRSLLAVRPPPSLSIDIGGRPPRNRSVHYRTHTHAQ